MSKQFYAMELGTRVLVTTDGEDRLYEVTGVDMEGYGVELMPVRMES